jgi:hypothetical protein
VYLSHRVADQSFGELQASVWDVVHGDGSHVFLKA